MKPFFSGGKQVNNDKHAPPTLLRVIIENEGFVCLTSYCSKLHTSLIFPVDGHHTKVHM